MDSRVQTRQAELFKVVLKRYVTLRYVYSAGGGGQARGGGGRGGETVDNTCKTIGQKMYVKRA